MKSSEGNGLKEYTDQIHAVISSCTKEMLDALTEFEYSAKLEVQRVIRDMDEAWTATEADLIERRRRLDEEYIGLKQRYVQEVDRLHAEKEQLESVAGKLKDELRKVGLI